MTRNQIIERLQDLQDTEASGLRCPACGGPTGVLYVRHPSDHTTRRRICGRCELAFTTCERIVGGYTPDDLVRARVKLAEWTRNRGGEITPIEPSQRTLFKIEDLELDRD